MPRTLISLSPKWLWSLLVLLQACAAVRPVDPQPFITYQQAIAELSNQSEQALQQVSDTELAQFKAKVVAGNKQQVATLALQFPPQFPFAWCYSGTDSDPSVGATTAIDASTHNTPNTNEVSSACTSSGTPLFAQMAAMQQGLAHLNQLLLDYAGTLQALSGATDSSQFNPADAAMRFTQQSQSLLSQVQSLGGNTGQISSSDIALFSTVAANLAQNYLQHKRKETLAQILQDGLAPLQKLVALAQRALDITAQSVKTQYQGDVFPQLAAVVHAQPDQGSAALDRLLATNQQLQTQLKLLANLYQAYGALVHSQQALVTAVNESQEANLAELILYSSQIRQQYESLRQQSAAASPKTVNATISQ